MDSAHSPETPAVALPRRTLLRGAAWSVPAVGLVVAAPAAVASAECAPESPAAITSAWSFDGSFGVWRQSRTGPTAPRAVYADQYGTLSQVALMSADPPANVNSSTQLITPATCFGPGTYSIAFDAALDSTNPRPVTFTVFVRNVTTGTGLVRSASITTTTGGLSSTSQSLTMTLARRTLVDVTYDWTFAGTPTGAAGDVAATAPRITRTASAG